MIAIDPGHGGYDNGCTWNGLVEKDLTLTVGRMLHAGAQALGLPAVLLRKEDVGLRLPDRGRLARAARAQQVLSVHFDSNNDPVVGQLTCYVRPGDDVSKALAKSIARATPEPLGPARLIETDGTSWKRRAHNVVSVHGDTPALLVECGFLSCLKHVGFLRTAEGCRALAAALLAGLCNHRTQ